MTMDSTGLFQDASKKNEPKIIDGLRTYPKDFDPITEYWEEIKSRRIIVGKKIKNTYRHFVELMEDKSSIYFYEPLRAKHVVEFIENFCRHSKGKLGGKPVRLMLWEKAMLAVIFGFVGIDGLRMIQKAVLIVGKKNGKSLVASCIGIYMMVADGEPGPEVYAVATKKDQARIIWLEAKRMVRKSAALRKRIKPLVGEMLSDFNDGVFKPLASDSDTLDGLNVYCALLDEIHQWKAGAELYNIIADGVTAREQPLIFETSTAGTIREDIYDDEYDEACRLINGYSDEDGFEDLRTVYFIYEIDERKEWRNPKAWIKANPGLGEIKNETILAEKVEKAKKNSRLVRNLVCKEFNIRETSTEAWLDFETLNNTEVFRTEVLKPRYGIGGIDLSTTTDLTCATVIFRVPDNVIVYVKQMYWLPGDLLEQRIHEDHIPYDVWMERGLLRVSDGNKVDYNDVTKWFEEVRIEDDIYLFKGGYDSWNSQYIINDLKNTYGKECFEPVVQGKKTESAPMKLMAAELKAKHINYNNNPVLKWCLANAAIDVDKNDNISLVKTSKSTKRIDGVASLLDAFVVYDRYYDDYMRMI